MRDLTLNSALGLSASSASFIKADWPAPAQVHTLISTRQGGVSQGVFAGLNVGMHVGDAIEAVQHNRQYIENQVGRPLAYLNQTHSIAVVHASEALAALERGKPMSADASVSDSANIACAVMTADCLPVLFCDVLGSKVAAAHAGWRGLAGGILQNTVAAMKVEPAQLMAYLGPAIGADAFEVRQDVWSAFCQSHPQAAFAFSDIGGGQYLADIYALARLTLHSMGVTQIYGGQHCTVLERDRFFSYRRDGQTGRMVSAVWLAPSCE